MAENEVTTVASTSVKKLKEYEVQRSMKWVNFTTTVQATSEEEAIEVAAKLGCGAATVTAKNEEVTSLEDIFNACWHVEANRTDDYGDDDEDDEEED
jgi:hypothetical protein